MKPEIIPFRPEHLTAFEWREGNREENAAWAKELMEQYDFKAYSAQVDGRIIGVAGFLLLGKRQAYAPVILSREIECHKVWFHREVRRGFHRLIREHGISYVFSWVDETSKRNCRWIRTLGFIPTGEKSTGRQGQPIERYSMGIICAH